MGHALVVVELLCVPRPARVADLSVAMRKSPVVAGFRSPVVAR